MTKRREKKQAREWIARENYQYAMYVELSQRWVRAFSSPNPWGVYLANRWPSGGDDAQV